MITTNKSKFSIRIDEKNFPVDCLMNVHSEIELAVKNILRPTILKKADEVELIIELDWNRDKLPETSYLNKYFVGTITLINSFLKCTKNFEGTKVIRRKFIEDNIDPIFLTTKNGLDIYLKCINYEEK